MKGKRYKKNRTKIKYRVIIRFICLLVFVSIFIISVAKILTWLNENKENDKIIDLISNTITIDKKEDSVKKYNVDFTKLKETNPDTIAWIKVNGTGIEYPVVKTNNNDYYLTHSFDKSYNSAGWVFMDYTNKFDGSDENIVIYAHNRRNGSLFGTLKNILTDEWQNNKENYIIPLISEKEKVEYKVFSVYQIENEDYYITTSFNKKEYGSFIKTIKLRSEKDFGVDVTNKDKVLTLSSCANNNKYRIVLHAVKIK